MSQHIDGIELSTDSVGAHAVDLVVGQLHFGKVGVPRKAKVVLVQDEWRNGDTIRARSAVKVRGGGNADAAV